MKESIRNEITDTKQKKIDLLIDLWVQLGYVTLTDDESIKEGSENNDSGRA